MNEYRTTRLKGIVNDTAREYEDMSIRYIADVVADFHEKGGTIKRKVTINGHKIPCGRCGIHNARRSIPNERPICEHCWHAAIDIGLSKLFIVSLFKGVQDIFSCAYGLESDNLEADE